MAVMLSKELSASTRTSSMSFFKSVMAPTWSKNWASVRGVVRLPVITSGYVKAKAIPRESIPLALAHRLQAFRSNTMVRCSIRVSMASSMVLTE